MARLDSVDAPATRVPETRGPGPGAIRPTDGDMATCGTGRLHSSVAASHGPAPSPQLIVAPQPERVGRCARQPHARCATTDNRKTTHTATIAELTTELVRESKATQASTINTKKPKRASCNNDRFHFPSCLEQHTPIVHIFRSAAPLDIIATAIYRKIVTAIKTPGH